MVDAGKPRLQWPSVTLIGRVLALCLFLVAGLVGLSHDHDADEDHHHAAGVGIVCGGAWGDDDEPDGPILVQIAAAPFALGSELNGSNRKTVYPPVNVREAGARGPPAFS